MKNRVLLVIGLLLIVALAVAGCTATTGQVQEAIEDVAPTLQAAATELVPTVEAIATEEPISSEEPVATAPTTDETSVESDESANEQVEGCDIANVPAPSSTDVMVRFVNASGNEMIVEWRDTSHSPPQLIEYSRLANGDTFDQETHMGHEWILREVLKDGKFNTLEYVVSAEAKQCVVLHHWGYEGEGAPENWAELRVEYEQCGSGQKQSPIDLATTTLPDLENVSFDYGETAVNILNNGHTIQVDKVEGNQITIGSETYQLNQFHFHAPSEHAVDDEHYPLEMHLVHQAANKALAVVGVFITEGVENSAFATVWDHLPNEETEAIATGATVNVADLLPPEQTFYRYSGSLTTPPCAQGVTWLVMKNPVEMSAEQIADFTNIIAGNNRPLQPLNARDVLFHETP